jgi:flagellar basal body-associated protein FliL
MSRKKKSGGMPIWVIILLVVLAAAGVFFGLHQGGGDSGLRTTEELDPEIYYTNANSLRGNTYKIDVEIDSALGNSPTKGRLFSVMLKQNKSNNGVSAPEVLPILVPPELGNLTIQKGQHYLMKVKVIENGLLKVEEATKP